MTPINCRTLVTGQLAYPTGCGNDGKLRDAAQCIDNADSYAWFANVSPLASHAIDAESECF